ncbi:hypothetical protein PFICI_06281 [Pestalotiopsis fici W106-1]|uniref:Uncharacterized protein n=1 Tax=Pestalotiopsis fici (strain W106-1 / CGMCC3.15140) TaxID=1229662 RepID=W3X5K1_PESFW|nr:uncharacterized protein PFICI_06281 [Pestalotiopsis fici W106-1]ETS81279.1 hypothetical protein PFICI_06281 [Pestalotiopsis fici W106-1]
MDQTNRQGLSSETLITTSEGDIPLGKLRPDLKLRDIHGINPSRGYLCTHEEDSPGGSLILFGFNDGKPFFSSGTIFFTTTGYRAVDPYQARLASGFSKQIGRLEIGHVVYKYSKSGSLYERVPITSISSEPCQSGIVAVGFTSGATSLDANGYLIEGYQNYVHMRKTAEALSGLSIRDLLKASERVEELQSIRKLLGDSATSRLLRHEIQTLRSGPHNSHFTRDPVKTILLDQVVRAYHVDLADPRQSPPMHIASSIGLFEGSVLVNGKVEARSHVDYKTKIISWSRALGPSSYEHGCITLVDHGLSGAGAVFLSPEDSPLVMHDKQHVYPVHVSTKPPAVKPTEALATTTTSLLSDSTDVQEMILDADIWSEQDKHKKKPSHPVSFGRITLQPTQIGGADGLNIPLIQIPLLDRLRDTINEKFAFDDPNQRISSLYKSTVNLSGQSDATAVVQLTGASLLAQLADEDPGAQVLGCTFKKSLGSDIILPILFQELQVSFKGGSVIGPIFAYDPLARGSLGSRHLLVSATEPRRFSDARLKVSSHSNFLETYATTGLSEAPAPVTGLLASMGALGIDSILNLPKYSEVLLHQTSSDLIYQAMLYHMNAQQRKDLLKKEKPQVPRDIPLALATNLNSDISTWLANIFAPAYIAKTIIESPTDPKQARNFTKQERAKLEYFWSGKGKTCLAMSQQYSKLTSIASSSAMLMLFPNLRRYQYNNTYWSDKLVTCLSDPNAMRGIVMTPIDGGTNQTNKIVNILSTLDGKNGLYAQDLGHQIWAHSLSQMLQSPYADTSKDAASQTEEWIMSSFSKLVSCVLDKTNTDFTISDKQRVDFAKDITTAESNYGLTSTGSPKARAAALLQAQADVIQLLSSMKSPLSGSSADSESGGIHALALPSLRSAGTTLWSWVSKAFDKTVGRLAPSGSGKMAGLKGFWSLILVGLYLYDATNGYSAWSGEAFGQTIVVTGTIQFMLDVTERVWDIYQGYKITQSNRAFEAAVAKVIDEETLSGIPRYVEFIAEKGQSLGKGDVISEAIGRKLGQYPMSRSTEIPKGTLIDVWEIYPVGMTEELAPQLQQVYKQFNLPGRVFAGITIVLSIVIVVSMTIDLKNRWDNLTNTGKALTIIQIGVTTASIFASELVVEALIWSNVAAADSLMVVSLPIVGAVLAFIGIVVMIFMSIFVLEKDPPKPPLTPLEEFIEKVGQPLISTWDDQRGPLLEYSIPSNVGVGGRPVPFVIQALNKTTSIMELHSISITFLNGDDDSDIAEASLFQESAFKMVAANDVQRDNPGNVYVTLNSDVAGFLQPSPRGKGGTSWNIRLESHANAKGIIRLGPGYGLALHISGQVAGTKGTSQIIIREDMVFPDDNNYQEIEVIKS